MIESIRVVARRLALKTPYALAFGTLHHYDAVRVALHFSTGEIGWGEAVALPGYGHETAEGIRRSIEQLGPAHPAVLKAQCEALWKTAPFAASAVLTALEMPARLRHAHRRSFALNVGGRWRKVKVGMELDGDIERALKALEEPDVRVTIDANQGYSTEQALAFARAVAGRDRLAWFEQPVDKADWDSMEKVCREAPVPILLDEPILDVRDVDRAVAVGAHGVKLKLCKHRGPAHTLRLARRAQGRGLRVVFGNGVAGALGNLAEYLVLSASPAHFAEPAECSGFLRVRDEAEDFGLRGDEGFICSTLSAEALAKRLHRYEG